MYRPLPQMITVGKSQIDGLGLVAVQDIPAHTELGIGHVRDERFEDGWIRTPLGGFINHSSKPNCTVEETGDYLIISTIKDVHAGEELTLYYTLYVPS